MGWMEAEIGIGGGEPRNAGSSSIPRRQGTPGGASPALPVISAPEDSFQTSDLQNCETIHSCCFKPPSSWQFVSAATSKLIQCSMQRIGKTQETLISLFVFLSHCPHCANGGEMAALGCGSTACSLGAFLGTYREGVCAQDGAPSWGAPCSASIKRECWPGCSELWFFTHVLHPSEFGVLAEVWRPSRVGGEPGCGGTRRESSRVTLTWVFSFFC